MAETVVLEISYIVKTPGVLGGDPRIAGRRIGVHDVVNLHLRLDTPIEEVARQFDLTLAEVYAALAYYHDHRDEIDAIIEANRQTPDPATEEERIAALRRRVETRMRDRRNR